MFTPTELRDRWSKIAATYSEKDYEALLRKDGKHFKNIFHSLILI